MTSRLAWTLAGALVAVLLAGCAASTHAQARPAAAPTMTVPAPTAPCAPYRCVPGPAIGLADGHAARLWTSAQPADGDASASTPVVELLQRGQHLSWWTGRLGVGWSARLSCLPTDCMLSTGLGAHGGVVQALVLQGQQLISPPTASVEFDSGVPLVADLNGDGLLDVLGLENDYRPNFAEGHNFWATYRFTGTALQRTGCLPYTAGGVRPAALLTGPCPVVPQG
jgi:hypothetical protein